MLLGVGSLYFYFANDKSKVISIPTKETEINMNNISEEEALQIAYNTDVGSQYKTNPVMPSISFYNSMYLIDFPEIWNGQYGYSVHIQIDSQNGKVISVDERQLIK